MLLNRLPQVEQHGVHPPLVGLAELGSLRFCLTEGAGGQHERREESQYAREAGHNSEKLSPAQRACQPSKKAY